MILVVGGAGYIGSHVVKELINQGFEVVVLDNLSTGHREAIYPGAHFVEGDIGNESVVESVFLKYPIQAVMQFAGSCLVGESVEKPLDYYQNNVGNSITLLKVMLKNDVNRLIFSSSCATYGIPETPFLSEDSSLHPVNPYGQSKLMVEKIIEDCSKQYNLSYIILRYFNVGGADHSGDIGEDHESETHLIPNILHHLSGKTRNVQIYGNDFDTPDGTCVRDYIHVLDVASAHILSLKILLSKEKFNAIYNIGNKKGYSVMEIVRFCEKLTGKVSKIEYKERRKGDPPYLVASIKKIEDELNWEPSYTIQDIISTAWNWHSKHPNGYRN